MTKHFDIKPLQFAFKFCMLLIGISFFYSCIEDGRSKDNIGLSTRDIEFSASADSVIITTQGEFWWINHIFFNDQYYNNENVDQEADSYIIVEQNFVIERRDRKTLFVKIDANNTGENRTMVISLQAGDYFDSVEITQSGN